MGGSFIRGPTVFLKFGLTSFTMHTYFDVLQRLTDILIFSEGTQSFDSCWDIHNTDL